MPESRKSGAVPTAQIRRFRSAAEQANDATAHELRQLVLNLSLPEQSRRDVLRAVDQRAAAANGWSFIMLSPAQNAAVVQWLAHNSKRPKTAMQVWSVLFTGLCRDTGEVLLSVSDIAENVGKPRSHVSPVLSELASVNAIVKRREPEQGSRGRGRLRIWLNPNVGTCLAAGARETAQAEAGQLDIVELTSRVRS